MVGAPLSTTNATIETKRIRDLIARTEVQSQASTEDINAVSDQAIDILYQQAMTDPENMRILKLPAPGKNSKGT